MNQNELFQQLYDKMSEEQETYRNYLLQQSPEEILNHTYEYTVRNDILMALEDCDLSEGQLVSLLNNPTPLAEVYHSFCKLETDYMETLGKCIEDLADKQPPSRDSQPMSLSQRLAYAREAVHQNQNSVPSTEKTYQPSL